MSLILYAEFCSRTITDTLDKGIIRVKRSNIKIAGRLLVDAIKLNRLKMCLVFWQLKTESFKFKSQIARMVIQILWDLPLKSLLDGKIAVLTTDLSDKGRMPRHWVPVMQEIGTALLNSKCKIGTRENCYLQTKTIRNMVE